MRKSKFTEEQIIGFLKRAEAGMAVAEICRKGGFFGRDVLQVARQVRRHGGVGRQAAEGAGSGERQAQEPAGGGAPGHACAQERSRGKALAPQVKREAIGGELISQHQMSERRACGLVGLSRDSYRNAPEASAQTEALKSKIVEIAHARRRFRIGACTTCCAWISPASITSGCTGCTASQPGCAQAQEGAQAAS